MVGDSVEDSREDSLKESNKGSSDAPKSSGSFEARSGDRFDPNRRSQFAAEGSFDPVMQRHVGAGATDAGAVEPNPNKAAFVGAQQLDVAVVGLHRWADQRQGLLDARAKTRRVVGRGGAGQRSRARVERISHIAPMIRSARRCVEVVMPLEMLMRRFLPLFGPVVLASTVLSCTGGPESVSNPAEVLSRSGQSRERYFDAIEAARTRGVDDATKAALRRMIAAQGYAIDARDRAFELLLATDRVALVQAIENSLPRMEDVMWRERMSDLIGEHQLNELVPTLIRAWANPVTGLDRMEDGKDMRPERRALVTLVGEDQLCATLLTTMRESNPATQANLRARCWELLMKNGDSARLRALLADADSVRGDAMLMDLARVAGELGILPVTREEILWARKLCERENAEFFEAAKSALASLPAARRESLEMRALPVVVALAKRRAEVLAASEAELLSEVTQRTQGRKKVSPDFTGYGDGFTETLYQQREKLSWTDLAAMILALDLVSERAVLEHLFEQADRDREDRTTEYGGVLAVDAQGRGEVLEFPARTKASDLRYESPQALFDALSRAPFHYHNHTQKYDNATYAGPHLGDFAFADSARCNGLVFTFLSTDVIDVDFYRHGRLVVDLGGVERPQG